MLPSPPHQCDVVPQDPVQQLDHGLHVDPGAGRVHQVAALLAALAPLGDAAPRLGRQVGRGVDHAREDVVLHEVGGAVAARRRVTLAEVVQVRQVEVALVGVNLNTGID